MQRGENASEGHEPRTMIQRGDAVAYGRAPWPPVIDMMPLNACTTLS